MVMRGGCVIDPEECGCACHKNKGMRHVTACCGMCPVCIKNISLFVLDAHKEECLKKQKEFLKSLESMLRQEEE